MKIFSYSSYGTSQSIQAPAVPRVGATSGVGISIGKDILLAGAGAAVGYFGFGRTWKPAAIGGAIGLGAAILAS
jgi:hypothetical protein